jgi:RimJ/RimL family protein N-acetyltransferase
VEIAWRLGAAHWGRGLATGDFNHPRLPRGHRLCRHVLYRLTQAAWRARAKEFL